MLKKVIRLNLDDLWLCCGIPAGLFFLLHLVTACVMLFGGEGTSLLVSGAVLPVAAGILLVIISMSHVLFTFSQALSLGRTRRNALRLWFGLSSFEGVCAMGTAALLTLLERAAAPALWQWLSGRENMVWGIGGRRIPESAAGLAAEETNILFVEDFTLAWWWFPVILAAALALGVVLGAVIQRFGRRGAWGLWGFWMLVCLFPQILPWQQYMVIDWLIPLAVLFSAALLAWALWSLSRAVIKN